MSSRVLQPLCADEIALVEQNDVAVTELVAGSLALELLEAKAIGIGNRDDRIDAHPIQEFRAQEGQHHRQRIRDPARLDNKVMDPSITVENAKDRIEEIVVDRTADAAVFQFHHVVGSGDDQVAVDADLAELVDDDGGAQALLVGEYVLDQCRLAATEEASDHGHG